MTERDPELQDDPRLRSIDASLVSYLDSTDGDPSSGFADSVMRSIEGEPMPRRGFAAVVAGWFRQPGPMRMVAQAAVAVAIVAAGIGSAIAISNLGGLSPAPGGEPSPLPSIEASVPVSPPPTPATSPTASPTPIPTSEPTESPDNDLETPEPGETPDSD